MPSIEPSTPRPVTSAGRTGPRSPPSCLRKTLARRSSFFARTAPGCGTPIRCAFGSIVPNGKLTRMPGPSLVFVHGIGSQLATDKLKQSWDMALAGRPIPKSQMADWCDRERSPEPLPLLAAAMPGEDPEQPTLPEHFPLIRYLTETYLPDCGDFLFDSQARAVMEESLEELL